MLTIPEYHQFTIDIAVDDLRHYVRESIADGFKSEALDNEGHYLIDAGYSLDSEHVAIQIDDVEDIYNMA